MPCLDQSFLVFHLGDTYFFFNELVKQQATTHAENAIFIDYLAQKRRYERYYGRAYVTALAVPYIASLFSLQSLTKKIILGYGLFSLLDALYDMGVYTYFFIHGPAHIRKVIELEPEKNFASIQTRLFMRYCATQEIKKAT